MAFAPVPVPSIPAWALTAARRQPLAIADIAAKGLLLTELVGGGFAAMAIGAAVIAVLGGALGGTRDKS